MKSKFCVRVVPSFQATFLIESPMSPDPALYARWQKIYPRYQSGFFRNLRWLSTLILVGLYAFLPFVRWDRGADLPNQAILFDLPARKFYLFSLTIWPQEIFLLAFALIFMAIALFFMTAIAGRVFCGYFCFQTIWTDLFLQVERWVEGSRKRRMNRDVEPWTFDRGWRKGVKHTLWLLIGWYTGAIFTAYFVDAPTLLPAFWHGTAPFAAWFTAGFLTMTTYLFAGMAREQVCIFMCPYARFQGAMYDEHSLIVAYDEGAGEPRQGNRRDRQATQHRGERVGWCIDCHECVTVCPTGIDIRNGQQYECITCAACVDACASVRDRVGMPVTLIRYTSLSELGGGKIAWFRPRILAYSGLMVAMLVGVVVYFGVRTPLEMTVIRNRQPIFIRLSDGGIQNNYTAHILNRSPKPQQYVLQVEGLDHAALSVAAISQKTAEGWPVLTVESGEVMPLSLYLKQTTGPEPIQEQQAVRFALHAVESDGGATVYHSVFIRPKP